MQNKNTDGKTYNRQKADRLMSNMKPITKTRLLKYTENFTTKKIKFSDKKF